MRSGGSQAASSPRSQWSASRRARSPSPRFQQSRMQRPLFCGSPQTAQPQRPRSPPPSKAAPSASHTAPGPATAAPTGQCNSQTTRPCQSPPRRRSTKHNGRCRGGRNPSRQIQRRVGREDRDNRRHHNQPIVVTYCECRGRIDHWLHLKTNLVKQTSIVKLPSDVAQSGHRNGATGASPLPLASPLSSPNLHCDTSLS